MRLEKIKQLTAEQLALIKAQGSDETYKQTYAFYNCIGEVYYGILGIVVPSLLGNEAAVWFIPSEKIRASLSEAKRAKKLNLPELIGYDLYADVKIGNTACDKFARFFGFDLFTQVDNYNVYRRLK